MPSSHSKRTSFQLMLACLAGDDLAICRQARKTQPQLTPQVLAAVAKAGKQACQEQARCRTQIPEMLLSCSTYQGVIGNLGR